MRKLIIFLTAVLGATLGWANLSSAATLAEGEQLANSGDIQGALSLYQELSRQQPDSAEVFARLGGMQLVSQHYADAVRSFQRAISLGNNDTGSFVGMGMAYLHMGQLSPARAAFVEAKQRGVEHTADLDSVIRWIDQRHGTMASSHP